MTKWKLTKKPELIARARGHALHRKRRYKPDKPPECKPLSVTWVTELNTLRPTQKLQTVIDSIVIKGLQ